MNDKFLNLIPYHNVAFLEDNERIVLLEPKFKNKILLKIFPKLKDMHFHIKLDSIASFVWKSINSENNVEKIIEIVKSNFADEPQIEERTVKFLGQLHHYKFILFKED
ncbi:MAG: PqqD family protein [Bacteroidales bacterium]|nr:PqqD family protein [Bacteroidales bacterium]